MANSMFRYPTTFESQTMQRNKSLISVLFLGLFICSLLYANQLTIPRIELMPNIPQPFLIRNWKKTTIDYDNFIFNTAKTGTYLPLSKIEPVGTNYPGVAQLMLDTYVGHNSHLKFAEGINVLPAIVGASLVGVDKTSHLGINWVRMAKNYFNLKNGIKLYLNHFNTKTGNDWWYQTMPNVYFFQLYDLYPDADVDFEYHFYSVANRHLESLKALGAKTFPWTTPYMNYRGFDFQTMKPSAETKGLQPESAGAYAWMLYQAYLKSNDIRYLQGTELALDFLQNWDKNPSYELQLPYGVVTAARMNAEQGTNYNLQKFLEWTFSAGYGTTRLWGCIIGKWGGYDVSGLIGEARDNGNDYAFLMNGFQQAAALLPVAKYDKRYARALSKWLLNLTNASRLFYPDELPQRNQQAASYNWSREYDPDACIPFESMKQNWYGVSPCAMGDAVKGGWGLTDLSLYTGSSVGYLASLIENTTVEGIIRLDLNKTDFRGENVFPRYLYFNPYSTEKVISLNLLPGNWKIYDAISEEVLQTNATGQISVSIPPDNVRLLVLYPADRNTLVSGSKLITTNGETIDYQYGYNFSNPLRIKSFSVDTTTVVKGQQMQFYCLPENCNGSVFYEWYVDQQKIAETTTGSYTWQVDVPEGIYQVSCSVNCNDQLIVSSRIKVEVNQTDKSWKVLVKNAISYNTASALTISIDSNGLPYVAYREGGSSGAYNYKLSVLQYKSDSWSPLGGWGIEPAQNPSIVVDKFNIPYVAFHSDRSSRLKVIRYQNTWETVGDYLSSGSVSNVQIECDGANNIWVAYVDISLNNRICVLKYDKVQLKWYQVGLNGVSPDNVTMLRLAVDNMNRPLVALKDVGASNKITVMRLREDAWEMVGSKGFSGIVDESLAIVTDSENNPIVAYSNSEQSKKISVQRFDGRNWNYLKEPTVSASASGNVDLKISKNDLLYLSFRVNTTNKIQVMKFSLDKWSLVGSLDNLLSGSMNNVRLAVNLNNNTVFVGCTSNFKAEVWMYSSENSISAEKSLNEAENSILVRNTGKGAVHISNLNSGSFSIYTSTGTLILVEENHKGDAKLCLSGGVYILRQGKEICKFVVF